MKNILSDTAERLVAAVQRKKIIYTEPKGQYNVTG